MAHEKQVQVRKKCERSSALLLIRAGYGGGVRGVVTLFCRCRNQALHYSNLITVVCHSLSGNRLLSFLALRQVSNWIRTSSIVSSVGVVRSSVIVLCSGLKTDRRPIGFFSRASRKDKAGFAARKIIALSKLNAQNALLPRIV